MEKKKSHNYSGSYRDWVRGTIIEAIKSHLTKFSLKERLIELSDDKLYDIEEDEIKEILDGLEREGLLSLEGVRYGDNDLNGVQKNDFYHILLFGKTYYLIEIRDFFKAKYPIEYKRNAEASASVPLGTKWQDITIEFTDEHNVKIKVKGKFWKKCDYKEMGFEDKRKGRPNKQWGFLREDLSKNGGVCSWNSSPAEPNKDDVAMREHFGGDGYNYKKSPNKKKHIKSKLAKQLKTFFDISEDPFRDYRKEKAYIIKIELIP